MMVWLILLILLTLFLLLPVGVFAEYDIDGLQVKLIAGFVRITIYPRRRQNNKKSIKDNGHFAGTKSGKRKAAGSFEAFMEALHLVLDVLKDLRKKIQVNYLAFNLILAGEDPCDLSVNYGACCAALGAVIPQIERLFVIKKRDTQIQCDYTAEKTKVSAQIDITLPIFKLISLCCFHGIHLLKNYREHINNTKAVQ